MVETPFETVYNAEMTCEACVKDIGVKLEALPGVVSVMCDLDTKTVAVMGTTPPSQILTTLQPRKPILRGTGGSNSAAVAILEDFESNADLRVRGLTRFVGLPNGKTFVDITMTGVPDGDYEACINTGGDVSQGVGSTGGVWKAIGALKCLNGDCQLYKTFQLQLSEIIGRSMVVTSSDAGASGASFCGVIARSAGAWENSKYVCSCTGKTIWDERVDAISRGIVS